MEEEVKSNEMIVRPTVYAGMQTKLERNVSGNDDGSSYVEEMTSIRGGRPPMSQEYELSHNARQIMNQYVDNSIDSNLNHQA